MLRDQPFMRDDTFLGVCQALGEDFRIPPNLLRLAIAPAIIWSPLMTLAIYVAAAVVIAVTRWIVPNPATTSVAVSAPAEVSVAANEPMELAKAA